jgi:hypothetical protein
LLIPTLESAVAPALFPKRWGRVPEGGMLYCQWYVTHSGASASSLNSHRSVPVATVTVGGGGPATQTAAAAVAAAMRMRILVRCLPSPSQSFQFEESAESEPQTEDSCPPAAAARAAMSRFVSESFGVIMDFGLGLGLRVTSPGPPASRPAQNGCTQLDSQSRTRGRRYPVFSSGAL